MREVTSDECFSVSHEAIDQFLFCTTGIVDFNFANLYLKNEFISNSFVQTDVIKINRINPLMFFEQISLKLVGAFYHLETFYLEKGKYCP